MLPLHFFLKKVDNDRHKKFNAWFVKTQTTELTALKKLIPPRNNLIHHRRIEQGGYIA